MNEVEKYIRLFIYDLQLLANTNIYARVVVTFFNLIAIRHVCKYIEYR